MKEYDQELVAIDHPVDQQPAAHQVLATLTEAEGDGRIAADGGARRQEVDPTSMAEQNAAGAMPPPSAVLPMSQPQNIPPSALTAQDPYTTPADKMIYGELLTEPITFDRIKDVSELDDKRKKLK